MRGRRTIIASIVVLAGVMAAQALPADNSACKTCHVNGEYGQLAGPVSEPHGPADVQRGPSGAEKHANHEFDDFVAYAASLDR
jgi:hypothetical protein